MKSVLVLAQDYPNNCGNLSLMYVHTRNVEYSKNGIDVTVINFSANESYNYEGIKVITKNDYNPKINYDVLICHAPNLKNHYRFLRKYGDNFCKFIFFFHGHEVLKTNEVYPKPYSYIKTSLFNYMMIDIYDNIKLKIWKHYFEHISYKSEFVFVSKWMQNQFFKRTKVDESVMINKCHIIYNCVGIDFELNSYDIYSEKKFDFVTIRSNLDGSKYCIDIINNLAKNTPDSNFLVIGKGDFFKHYKKSDNITWIEKNLSHSEIISFLNQSKYALMPTRCDAQGLMMCEMAAFGIPVITSDIDVCIEVFENTKNIFFISNDSNESLEMFNNIDIHLSKDTRYYKDKTMSYELNLINEVILS